MIACFVRTLDMKQKYIIYGATGGVGSVLAGRLHQAGCSLHLAGRDEERLREVAERYGAGCSVFDALDDTSFDRVTKEAGEEISGLAYCVGTINLRSIGRLGSDDYIRDFQINAAGAALAVSAATRSLKKSPETTSVVLFSSVAADKGFPMHASIGMAKGAVSSLTLALAAELAPKIRVNAIAPSLTRTPLAEKLLSNPGQAQQLADMHPMKRLGEAGDIAAMAAFLLSPESGWISGQIIGVDGGRSALESN